MKCVVNFWELLFCYCGLVMLLFLSMYKFYESQATLLSENPQLANTLTDLTTGWTFLKSKIDYSNLDWVCLKYFIKASWFCLIFQFSITEILREFKITLIKYWYILSSLIFTVYFMDMALTLVFVLQPVIFTTVALKGKRILIWGTSLILFYIYTFFWDFESYFIKDNTRPEIARLFYVGILWNNLRCINFCFEFIEKQEKEMIINVEKNQRTNLYVAYRDVLSYVLYLPVSFMGPIISYEDFENSFRRECEKLLPRLKIFAVDVALSLVYSYLLEFHLHFIYINAMSYNKMILEKLPPIALIGGGIWLSFHFHIIYVILYGLTTSFARLDNIEAPPIPRCVARIHVYSDMWKYFDVGMYSFLLKYCYRPCYLFFSKDMKLLNLISKLLSSFITFTFIFLWHGASLTVFIWCGLNFLGLAFEYIAKYISTTNLYSYFKHDILKTGAAETRFKAMICSPLLALSIFSNFIFFGGPVLGNVYAKLLVWPEVRNVLMVLTYTYCCGHVSMSLRDVPSRTDKRNKTKVE